jgi:hypothetical protein
MINYTAALNGVTGVPEPTKDACTKNTPDAISVT